MINDSSVSFPRQDSAAEIPATAVSVLLSLHWDGWEHAIYSPSFYILDFFLEDPFLF